MDLEDEQCVTSLQRINPSLTYNRHKVVLLAKSAKASHPTHLALLEEKRSALKLRIKKWRDAQRCFMPGAKDTVESLPIPDSPEVDSLIFPHSLRFANQIQSCVAGLPNKEKRLREAQADTALSEIRRLLRIRSSLLRSEHSISGQRALTRSHATVESFNQKIESNVARYRTARLALLALDPSLVNTNTFPILSADDVRGPGRQDTFFDAPNSSRRRREAQLGEGSHQPSWIWLVGTASQDADADSQEFDEGEIYI